MDATALAAMIDHTLLRPEATAEDIASLAVAGAAMRTASVCVNPGRIGQVSRALRDSPVLACSVVAFPFGIQDVGTAVAEARAAVAAGAAELDVVAPLHAIADRDGNAVLSLLERFRADVPRSVVVKVILETSAFDDDQIVMATRAAVTAGADFVKTSTGFHPSGGATVHAVGLLAGNAGTAGVKASGGIRTLATARSMLAAGATRLGCSATAAILAELEARS